MSKRLPVSLKLEDFNRIMKLTKQKHHKIAFALGFHSGLRISEIINLKPEQIFLKEKSIRVIGKGDKERVVPLPKGFSEKHLNYIPMKCGIRSLEISFKNKVERLKLDPRLHFHSLRHGFATRAIERGIPLNQVQLALGHASVKTTSIYIQANPKDMLKSFEENF